MTTAEEEARELLRDGRPPSLIEWTHPRLGRISEVACGRHETEVLCALRTLGIGCGGRAAPGRVCHRCAHRGSRVATWLAGVAEPITEDAT